MCANLFAQTPINTTHKLFLYLMGNSPYCIGVIGLGYVGLPLAVEFGKYYPVIGFDINKQRIEGLQKCNDVTLEVEHELLKQVMKQRQPAAAGVEGDDEA